MEAYKLVRYLAYLIEIIILYVIEQIPQFIPHINGAKPLLVLPVVCIIAMFEGERTGLVFGFLTGMLLDVTATGTIGFYTIVVAIIGYFLGLGARYVIETVNLFNTLVGCFIGIFVFYSLYFLIMFVMKNYPETMYAFVNYYLIGAAYTFVIVPLIYFFNRALAINIRKEE